MKCWKLCVPAGVAAALVSGAGFAQVNAGVRPITFAAASASSLKPLSPEQREEWRFLKEAFAASRFETEASRLALAKSNDAGVRSLAATLVNHHSSATAVLQHMLHVRNMAPPMLANDQRVTLNRLTKLQGIKFDREYMEQIGLKVQQEDVQAYEKAGAVVRDPALKAWIDKTLPTLRFHVTTADRVMAGNTRLSKSASMAQPLTVKRSPAQLRAAASAKFDPRAATPTQFVDAAPARADAGSPGGGGTSLGNLQLGPPQPVAVRATAPNSR